MRRPAGRLAWLLALLVALGLQAAEIVPGVELREAWIEMPDGARLAADLYLPAQREANARHPVLLEYLPYRKTDARARNAPLYHYFVEHGYVVARVDVRGTGNSEGTLVPQEYSEIEQSDGESVIAWLAAQPWSNGKVGMFGISWSGFNAIQLAARKPPALKAFLALHATEDLYREDVHFIDGIMHVDSWELSQDLDNARPGAPDYVIDERYFRERFDQPPWMLMTKREQRDGPYWERASLLGRQQELTVPGYFIGGWYDSYRNAVARMLQNMRVPVKGMIGAWSHTFPHEAYPLPSIEWRADAVRWFDHFLRGTDTGILDEPRFAVYVREWHEPGPLLTTPAPGRWRSEDGWPPATTTRTLYARDDHSLGDALPRAATQHRLRYVPSAGYEAGGPVMWWGDVAHDQRGTDAFSLVYDSAPLEEAVEILGRPRALLRVSADAPRANWFVRLSDVAPDGRVTLVTGAGANGMHRFSARYPEPLVPGESFPLAIDLYLSSWVFAPGHRIRISVNNAQWPMFWPTPYPMTTTLAIGGEGAAQITLPVVPTGRAWREPQFPVPGTDPQAAGFATIDDGGASLFGEISEVTRNPQTGAVKIVATNRIAQRYPWGIERNSQRIEHSTNDNAPADTTVTSTDRFEVELPGRRLVWESEVIFLSDETDFRYDGVRRLYENGRLLREKHWEQSFPRD